MNPQAIDLSPLRKALALLIEALEFWNPQPEGGPLKPHLRSAVIRPFEATYELTVRLTRRVWVERAESADRVVDLSSNECCGLPPMPVDARCCAVARMARDAQCDESR